MAEEYLRTRYQAGMRLQDVLADLGEPSGAMDCWTYAVGAGGLGEPERGIPLYTRGVNLHVWFTYDGRVTRASGAKIPVISDPPEFSLSTWHSTLASDRAPLGYDLIKSRALKGMAKDEVKRLLGQPDAITEKRIISYKVGQTFSDAINLEFFVNSADKVVDARIN